MRISHLELETARRDVAAWVRERAASTGSRRRGYNQIVKEAIFSYHRGSGDRVAAQEYLRRGIAAANLRNPARVYSAELDLEAYMDWFEGSRVVATGQRLMVSLPLGGSVTMGGLVSRSDYIPPGRYRGVLLVNEFPPAWETELRMPLLQRAVATLLQRNEADVSIGVQSISGGQVFEQRFTTSQIRTAVGVARKIAEAIDRANASPSGPEEG